MGPRSFPRPGHLQLSREVLINVSPMRDSHYPNHSLHFVDRIDDSEAADAILPVRAQFASEWLTAFRIKSDLIYCRSHRSLHIGRERADDLCDPGRDIGPEEFRHAAFSELALMVRQTHPRSSSPSYQRHRKPRSAGSASSKPDHPGHRASLSGAHTPAH